MKNTYKYILVLFVTNFLLAQEFDCVNYNKNEIEKNSNSLSLKISQIKQYLDGKEVVGFSPLLVFGADFNISQTNTRIENNKKIIQQTQGFESAQELACVQKILDQSEFEELKNKNIDFITLKIQLLEKNKILNDGVRTANETQNNIPEILKDLDKETKSLSAQKDEVKNEIDAKENKLLIESDGKNKDLITFESNLSKIKLQLLERKIEQIASMEKKIAYFSDINAQISIIFKESVSEEVRNRENSFKKVEELWLKLSQENYYELIKEKSSTEIPVVNGPPQTIKLDEKLKLQLEEVVTLRSDLIKYISEKKHQELSLLNDLIVSCSGLRSALYLKVETGYFWQAVGNLSVFTVLKNEILFSPYRIISFFYTIYLKTKDKLEMGRAGYLDLSSIILKYLLLFIPIFLLNYFFEKIDGAIDIGIRRLIHRFRQVHYILQVSAVWVKFRESLLPILWITLINIFKTSNEFSSIKYLLNGCEIYFISKILQNVIIVFLGSISRIDTNSFSQFKIKSGETSQKFEDIYLIYAFLLLFLEATIGRAFVYTLVNYGVLIYSVYQLIRESSRWQDEFEIYLEKKFAGVITKNIFSTSLYLPLILRSTYILIFILVLTVVDLLISLTENFDFSKKVSANLFKKQIEKIEAESNADEKISASYKELFSIRSLEEIDRYVESGQGLEQRAKEEIELWLKDDSEEHSLVFYGDKGVGKTTLLKYIIKNTQAEYLYAKIPSKTTTNEKLHAFLGDILCNGDKGSVFDINQIDKQLDKKIVVVLDEAQNIFLSQTQGFEAYYSLIDIINQTTTNIYWILSFNKYSWLYLDRAFGRTQFFRNVIELKGWSDLKIKELIMRRHALSEFKLSYDLLISATSSQDEIDRYSSIESKFFKLLWEVSRGNPRYALQLWISALSRKNAKTLNVNVPKFAEIGGLDRLSDDLMFVMAEVLKHENLTSSEIQDTTNLTTGIIRNAIKMGLERKYFFKDERGRYMIELSMQYPIIKFLRLKNFIYGN